MPWPTRRSKEFLPLLDEKTHRQPVNWPVCVLLCLALGSGLLGLRRSAVVYEKSAFACPLQGVVLSASDERLVNFRKQWPGRLPLDVVYGPAEHELPANRRLFTREYRWFHWLHYGQDHVGDDLVAVGHHRVLQHIAEATSPCTWFAVFEDDAMLSGWNYTRLLATVPADAELVSLFPRGIPETSTFWDRCRSGSGDFVHFQCGGAFWTGADMCGCGGTVGFLITPARARAVLESLFPLSQPVDLALWQQQAPRAWHGNPFVSAPPGVYVATANSTTIQHPGDDFKLYHHVSLKNAANIRYDHMTTFITGLPDLLVLPAIAIFLVFGVLVGVHFLRSASMATSV